MKKSKILTMVTLSTLVLAQAGTAFADESDIAGTVDDTVVVTPSTTGSDSSTDMETDKSNAGDDVNDTIDSGSGVIETPTTPITDDSSSEATPSTETDVVGGTTQTENSESDSLEDKSDTQMDSEETQTETLDGQKEQETGTVEVPTTTGETATVNTDKSQPTKNPNVSSQTAYDAGVSQVGTMSQVTGQIVRDVTTANPVTLISGVTITDIQSGIATLSDGSSASLTDLGVTENEDKTFSATTIDGEQVTLPETGESTVGVIVGLLIILAGFGLGFKDKLKALIDNVKAKFKK